MDHKSVDRRQFMKHAAAASAAAVTAATRVDAQGTSAAQTPEPPASGGSTGPEVVLTGGRPGSDFMVDVIKSLGVPYVLGNPGSSYRGLQESIVMYANNTNPQFITCLHEESSVAMAHGYAKVEGKPLVCMAHGTVGLQHASMAIYNAWCDRVPVVVMLGNTLDATMRAPGVEWVHSVQDAAAMVRDYTKWDDTPYSLQHFAESAVRAYKVSMTPWAGPVVLVADAELQERPIADQHGAENLRVPKLTLASPPQADAAAVNELARLLVAASAPVFVADRCARTQAGLDRLVELADTLGAPVVSAQVGSLPPLAAGRLNFPTRHPLNHTMRAGAAIGEADVVVGLEVANFFGATNTYIDQLHRTSRAATGRGAKLVTISAGEMNAKANYQDFQRYAEVDLALAGDAEATLPAILDAVNRLLTADQRRACADRRTRHANTTRTLLMRAREDATVAWDAVPVSTGRLASEIWAAIRDEDWCLVNGALSGWPLRLWDFQKTSQYVGVSGGSGIGYGAPAAVGAALANKKYGRLSVNIQNDGDLMYAPGVLWTAARYKIPVLSIMNNNRAYHEEIMHLQRMASRRERGPERASIGCTIDEPNIDYTKLAQSMGMYAEGPISDPRELPTALRRAIAVVKRGEPALLDVVMQPR